MKTKKLKKAIAMSLFGILAIGSTVFAGGFGGYRLPVNQGNNYWGLAHKANGPNSVVYNQVDLLTNTDRATFWITESNKNQVSNDYYFKAGENKNMFSYKDINSGYVGMENYYNTNKEAYVDGWINFN